MSLITKEYVKEGFPLWESYFINPSTGKADESVLQSEIDRAETILVEYLQADEDNITEQLKNHLLNIVKYLGFVLKHGDTEFKEKTQIVKDYEMTMQLLKDYKAGITPITPVPLSDKRTISVQAKERLFK